jgi:hypothetical protein
VTAVDASTDLELIEHLDFVPEVPCEVWSKSAKKHCGAPAQWWAIHVCCGRAESVCEPHRQELLIPLNRPVRCNQCDARFPSYHEAVTFIPIGSKP